MRRLGVVTGLLLLAFLALAPGVASAAAGKVASVSLLNGDAQVLPGGDEAKKQALKVGATVSAGDAVLVGDKSFLELSLPDKSVVRVAPGSRLVLEAILFEDAGERSFSARLMFGSVWSKVSTVLGGESKFEVKTDNAVAGVRGTTFRVDARSDKSAVVSVFAGSVAVGKGGPIAASHTPGARKEKAAPKQVSKAEWEKLVLGMMKVSIAADGTPGEPEKVTEADIDDFARFNQKRDN